MTVRQQEKLLLHLILEFVYHEPSLFIETSLFLRYCSSESSYYIWMFRDRDE